MNQTKVQSSITKLIRTQQKNFDYTFSTHNDTKRTTEENWCCKLLLHLRPQKPKRPEV